MPLADVGERLQRTLEIVVRREQRLGDVGARPGSDSDPTPARALVDEPRAARRAFAVDDDAGDVVAQFDRQIEMGVDRRVRAEIEPGPADLATLSVERAHGADRWCARVRVRDPHSQRARFIVGAGERQRRLPIGHDLDRPGHGREPGRKGARSAEFDPVGDP